ncbi:MAG TPA: phosphoribosyl-AMP cyclohydrolase [Burkholderiaceae bacterium]|nr:phosphoribosyl-AMP cyclohydrolase [Burkholderiaceae bacterium]
MSSPDSRLPWLQQVHFNTDGLVAAIAQDAHSGRVLMLAWMNAEALAETHRTRQAVYWSRSRQALWRKGEQSGHTQQVHRMQLDCDGDAVLLHVTQHGGIACHTGRQSCFYRELPPDTPEQAQWLETEPILKDPGDIYS